MSNIHCTRTPRYSLHPVANQILATKCPKTMTAAHLSINNSKTKAVSSFSQAYSSEGVLLLAVDTREWVAKLLRYPLQSHKVQEAEMVDFSPFFFFFFSPKTVQLKKGSYSSVVVLRLCPRLPFVSVAIIQFEI